jgi:hypothetical protein
MIVKMRTTLIFAFQIIGVIASNWNLTYPSIQTAQVVDKLNNDISVERSLQTNSSLVRICLYQNKRYVTKSIRRSEVQPALKKGAKRGPCDIGRCRTLCNHRECNDDYKVSSSSAGPVCQCKRHKFSCGTGASCINDQCRCDNGYVGNPLMNCTLATQPSPIPTYSPTTSPISLLEYPTSDLLDEFCWKSSYNRGVGRLQDSCPPDQEMRGLNCYSRCPSGYTNVLLDCVQVCPSGWRDDGIFCYLLGEYWRGYGFALWDKSGCERTHGEGNCEIWGVNWFQKCKSGFSGLSENCFPPLPNCIALGFSGGLGLYCSKSVKPGNPKPLTCGAGLQLESNGLCYQPCQPGYSGVLFLCWEMPPTGWVECAFGAARDNASCSKALQNQLLAVLNIAQFFYGLVVDAIVELSAEWVEVSNQFSQFQGLIMIFFTYNGGAALIIAWKSRNGGYTPEEVNAMDPKNEPINKMKLIVDSFAELYKTFSNKPCSQLQI